MDEIASARNWQKLRLPSGNFVLTAYAPALPVRSAILTIYIEGDGLAWLSRSRPSDDPTPNNPLGLELALRHPNGAVAYLSRPCQNVGTSDWAACNESYWTGRRFAPDVVDASDKAINQLKQRSGAEQLVLVGYSGGGAIAALVAANRQDVIRLITVAGNMDTAAWTTDHHIDPLTGSLNPADSWEKLERIPQLHFVGSKDQVVSASTLGAFRERFPPGQRPPMRVIENFDHVCCWVEQWPDLAQNLFQP